MAAGLSSGQWLEAQFVEGRTVADVATELSVGHRSVRYAAHRHGVVLPQHRTRERRRSALEDIEQLCAFVDDGLTITEIAARASATTSEVRAVLLANGMSGRDRRNSDVDTDRVRQLVNSGYSFGEIAAQLATSPKTVRSIAAEYGLTSHHVQRHPTELRDAGWLHREYVEADRSLGDIARELNVAAHTVRAALMRLSIPTRPVVRADTNTIRLLMSAGRTIAEVADVTGLSSETVRRHATQLGLHTPNTSRPRPELVEIWSGRPRR
jgi:DNA-binding CsgD family transcriptional regulator